MIHCFIARLAGQGPFDFALLAVARMEINANDQGSAEDDHARTEHAERVASAVAEFEHDPGKGNSGQCENEFGGHRSTPL